MHGCGVIICMMLEGFYVKTAAIRLISKFAEAGKKMQRAETGRPKSAQGAGVGAGLT